MKILVVDDFLTMRRIVKNLLSSLGENNIDQAEDGAVAFKMLKNNPDYDLVITDWNMPNKDGLELLKDIRSTPELATIPVLMITAEAKKSQIIEAAHAGVNGYIVKPFSGGMLKDKLDNIFKRINKSK